jgi:hypothetical protein
MTMSVQSSTALNALRLWSIAGILLLNGGTLFAQKETPQVRNIVLVHGAWADGGASHGVYVSRAKEVATAIEEAASHAVEQQKNNSTHE